MHWGLFFYELGFRRKPREKSETLWKSGMNLTEIVQTIVWVKYNRFLGAGQEKRGAVPKDRASFTDC